MEIDTIGYASLIQSSPRDILPGLIEIAKEYDLLVDVRSRPWGLVSKKELIENIPNYVHIKSFGNPEYKDVKNLEEGKNILKKYNPKKILLMCAEKDERKCHRGDIRAYLKNGYHQTILSDIPEQKKNKEG